LYMYIRSYYNQLQYFLIYASDNCNNIIFFRQMENTC
jgi:hypothetical protein